MSAATAERAETSLERLTRLEAEANTIRAQIKAEADRERPQAMRTVGELIAKHGITRTELNEMVRKRAFAPRPRKAKEVAP
jgi:DNA-binding protein H-NS